jgi:hypothetical protein
MRYQLMRHINTPTLSVSINIIPKNIHENTRATNGYSFFSFIGYLSISFLISQCFQQITQENAALVTAMLA